MIFSRVLRIAVMLSLIVIVFGRIRVYLIQGLDALIGQIAMSIEYARKCI
jgi:uncharacterized membrane protein